MEAENSETFSFADYDVVGFDLDNCLCRYNLSELLKLEYGIMSSCLLQTKKYSEEFLSVPYEQDKDFALKGLFLDFERGNILKISSDGSIIQATHGTRLLNPVEIRKIYKDAHWESTDRYVSDPLSVSSGPDGYKVQTLIDYFDTPEAVLFVRIIDDIEKKQQTSYNIFPDLLKCLHDMYDHENFAGNRGGFYPALRSEPSKYILSCGDHVIDWIKSIRNEGKITFLLTSSDFDYASFIAEKALGPNWQELFDIKIFKGRKPGFWNLRRPFKNKADQIVPGNKLEIGGNYREGNFEELKSFFRETLGKCSPKVVYMGDNILHDIYSPHKFCNLDTVAIVEELEAEGLYGYKKVESENSKLITSKFWGSFFAHKGNSIDTIWTEFISRHAKFLAPSISVLAEKPVNYRYKIDDDKNCCSGVSETKI